MEVLVGYHSQHAGEYVGRPSPLGNPFSHKPSRYASVIVPTIEEALANYAVWLDGFLAAEIRGPVAAEFDRLKELLRLNHRITLRCWCSEHVRPVLDPPRCHADIIGRRLLEALGFWPPIRLGQLPLL
jgi:hypothetical protein